MTTYQGRRARLGGPPPHAGDLLTPCGLILRRSDAIAAAAWRLTTEPSGYLEVELFSDGTENSACSLTIFYGPILARDDKSRFNYREAELLREHFDTLAAGQAAYDAYVRDPVATLLQVQL